MISADTSYAANTLWDIHNTGEWSSLPQRRSAASAIRNVGGSYSIANSVNSTQFNTPRHSVSVAALHASLGRRSPQQSVQAIIDAKTSGLMNSDMAGRLPRLRSPARDAMPPLDFSSLTVSQKQKLAASQMDSSQVAIASATGGNDEIDFVIQTARAALEADSPRRASLILTDSFDLGISRRSSGS